MAKSKTRRAATKDEPPLKQRHIADMAPPSIPDIDDAAEDYVRIRNERMELTEEETSAQQKLLILMAKHGLESYEFDLNGTIHLVSINELKKVRVKKKPAEGSNGQEA